VVGGFVGVKPFGEPIRVSDAMANLNPFRFSTKYTDDESDFLYYGCRYYNSETGRWIGRDNVANGQKSNPCYIRPFPVREP
jgi:RHS repeat-associated protein